MAHYSLEPNEYVLLKDESVMHGGFMAGHTDELTLTNLNLVLVKKGLFGNAKGVLTFPVNQIKVYNRQAQATIGKATNGADLLEVYFLNGRERFNFQSGGKKKILSWIAKINQAVTGEEPPEIARVGMAIPGAGVVAGALKDTFNVFKGKFAPAPQKVTKKCSACAAPISGTAGQVISCEYCATAQQL